MKKNIFLVLLLVVSMIAGAQNWNTAVAGFSSYDVDEFEKAKGSFESALKHEKEFSKAENAKLYYYYGKTILKTANEDLEERVEAYNALEKAAQYDEGEYKATLKVEMEELRETIKKQYDTMPNHNADDEETIEIYLRACEIIGYLGSQEDYEIKLKNLKEKE